MTKEDFAAAVRQVFGPYTPQRKIDALWDALTIAGAGARRTAH